MQQNNKKNKFMILMITLSIILVGALVTYSFTFIAASSQKQTANLSTGSMFLVFSDGDSMGINKSLNLGDSVIKKFTIENRGTVASSLSLDWENLINTYLYGSLSYVLNKVDASGNVLESIITKTNMPVSKMAINQTIASELSVPAGLTYYYDLVITFNDLDIDQTADVNAKFQTTFKVSQPSKYRYYETTVLLNGGNVDGNSVVNVSLLKQGGTYTIGVPARDGYNFAGWTTQGLESSIVDSTGVFTMGISDTYLTANWTPVSTNLHFVLNGGTYTGTQPSAIGYEQTIVLTIPTKADSIFTGWSVSGGLLNTDGLTFTQDTLEDVTITANWIADAYDCDIGITNNNTSQGTVSVNSINVGYGSSSTFTVTPNEGYYLSGIEASEGYTVSGFTTGTSATGSQTVTITNSNTANNGSITITFEALEYPVSITNTTASYGSVSTNSINVPYKGSNTFTVTANTGYKLGSVICTNGFTTGVEGDLTGSPLVTVHQPSSGSVSTDTNCNVTFIGREYSVTLNPNGGTLTTPISVIVTYGSTYGDLGTPTYEGYRFAGWNTEADGSGNTITADTVVNITSGQILYAEWREEWSVTDIVTAIVNHQTPSKGVANTNITLWNTVETADATIDGLYTAEDDYGTSYYYRGAASNNYVKFGKNSSNQDLYWRIIRVNGDGSVRMIYDGTSLVANANGSSDYSHEERFTHTSVKYATSGGAYKDAKYVGYMYGPEDNSSYMTSVTMNGKTVIYSTATNSQVTASEDSAAYAQANTVSSYVKYLVEKWYEDNLKTNYGEYLSDEIFCVDRSITSGNGYGTNVTNYGSYTRYYTNNANAEPTYECATNNIVNANNDKFTMSDTTHGNGALAYPIGLITANEIAGAGGFWGVENRYFYLYKSSDHRFWSLSPYFYSSGNGATVFMVNITGGMGHWTVSNSPASVAPVINIAPAYAAQLLGNGTINSPYQLPVGE